MKEKLTILSIYIFQISADETFTILAERIYIIYTYLFSSYPKPLAHLKLILITSKDENIATVSKYHNSCKF